MSNKILICLMIWIISTTFMVCFEGVRLLAVDKQMQSFKRRIIQLENAVELEYVVGEY